MLRNIRNGFEQEGLGDLVQNVNPESGPTGSRTIKTKIKNEILKKYPESLFLPVWIVKEKNSYRRFSYDIDIKPKLNWKNLKYNQWLKNEILPALEQKSDVYEYLIDLEEYKKRYLDDYYGGIFETPYLARRIMDVVDNAFVAFDLAKKIIRECKTHKNNKILKINSGFIIQELVKRISQEKEKQEKNIFNLLIKERKLILGVSEENDIGYLLPKECEVYPEGIETFRLNLFEKSDVLSMNHLERKIANLIDNKESVLWWVRNIAESKKWYAIRGWRKGKILPDFIVAKKKESNSLELVYIIESKGEHLINNPDTQYKKGVFDKMNEESIEVINTKLIKFKLNKKFQFELVEQGNENIDINKFFSVETIKV